MVFCYFNFAILSFDEVLAGNEENLCLFDEFLLFTYILNQHNEKNEQCQHNLLFQLLCYVIDLNGF